MNKNQKQIRSILEPGITSFLVPRRDYDKGCSNSRPVPSAFITRNIPFGNQKRKSTKAKVAFKRK